MTMQPDSQSALPPEFWVGRYQIREVIGSGAFGITYKAWDRKLDCLVAIKEYFPAAFAARTVDSATIRPRIHDGRTQFQRGIEYFLNEARTLAKFKGPNIVRVTNFIEANGTAYMVMDYEDGQTLQEFLLNKGRLSEQETREIILPILGGLSAVHRKQYLHRDIKPSNIYLRRNGPPLLIDFGASRTALGRAAHSLPTFVSFGYAPAEQYSPHSEQGPASDMYAVGATVFRCLVGEVPEDALSRHSEVIEGREDPVLATLQGISEQVSPAFLFGLKWCLQRSPGSRPQSVDDLVPFFEKTATQALPERGILSLPEDEDSTPVSNQPSRPAAKKTQRVFAASLVAAMILVLALSLAVVSPLFHKGRDSVPQPVETAFAADIPAQNTDRSMRSAGGIQESAQGTVRQSGAPHDGSDANGVSAAALASADAQRPAIADGPDLVLSAPPRESEEQARLTYVPLARYLSTVTGQRITYRYPGDWGVYQQSMQNGEYDLVFDGPHFASWRIRNLGHIPVARARDNLVFVIIVRTEDARFNKLADLGGYSICGLLPPNLATLTALNQFPSARQPNVTAVDTFKQAYDGLLNGKCDAAVMRDTLFAQSNATGKARVVFESEPLPNQVLTAGPRVSVQMQRTIQNLMTREDAPEYMRVFLERFNAGKPLVDTNKYEYAQTYLLLKDVLGFGV